MEVVVDLLRPKTVTSVGVDCLENMRSWVFFPTKVEVSISNDGKTYQPWASVENTDFAAIRERLAISDVPEPFRGTAIALIPAGLMSMAFMAFQGFPGSAA